MRQALPMHFVGVDLAWGERKPTGLAVLDDDGRLVHVSARAHRRGDRRGAGAVRRGRLPGRDRRAAGRHQRDRQPAGRGGAEPRLRPLRRRRAPVQHRQAGVRATAPRGAARARGSASTWTRGPGARAGRSRSTRTRRRSRCSGSGRTLKYKNKPGPRPRRRSAPSCSLLIGLLEGLADRRPARCDGSATHVAAWRGAASTAVEAAEPQERAAGRRGPGRRRRLRLRRAVRRPRGPSGPRRTATSRPATSSRRRLPAGPRARTAAAPRPSRPTARTPAPRSGEYAALQPQLRQVGRPVRRRW